MLSSIGAVRAMRRGFGILLQAASGWVYTARSRGETDSASLRVVLKKQFQEDRE